MQIIKKILATFLVSGSLITPVLAKPMSSTIDFAGGTIAPRSTYFLDLHKLVSGIYYDIQCDLNNLNQDKIVLGLNISHITNEVYLDTVLTDSQPHISRGTHSLRITNISNTNIQGVKIIFTNGDQDNSLIVTKCSATAV